MPAVRKAIRAEVGDDPAKQEATREKGRAYASEIAADISHSTIRMMLLVLRWLWNQIYDGIELTSCRTLARGGKGQGHHLHALPPQPF